MCVHLLRKAATEALLVDALDPGKTLGQLAVELAERALLIAAVDDHVAQLVLHAVSAAKANQRRASWPGWMVILSSLCAHSSKVMDDMMVR